MSSRSKAKKLDREGVLIVMEDMQSFTLAGLRAELIRRRPDLPGPPGALGDYLDELVAEGELELKNERYTWLK